MSVIPQHTIIVRLNQPVFGAVKEIVDCMRCFGRISQDLIIQTDEMPLTVLTGSFSIELLSINPSLTCYARTSLKGIFVQGTQEELASLFTSSRGDKHSRVGRKVLVKDFLSAFLFMISISKSQTSTLIWEEVFLEFTEDRITVTVQAVPTKEVIQESNKSCGCEKLLKEYFKDHLKEVHVEHSELPRQLRFITEMLFEEVLRAPIVLHPAPSVYSSSISLTCQPKPWLACLARSGMKQSDELTMDLNSMHGFLVMTLARFPININGGGAGPSMSCRLGMPLQDFYNYEINNRTGNTPTKMPRLDKVEEHKGGTFTNMLVTVPYDDFKIALALAADREQMVCVEWIEPGTPMLITFLGGGRLSSIVNYHIMNGREAGSSCTDFKFVISTLPPESQKGVGNITPPTNKHKSELNSEGNVSEDEIEVENNDAVSDFELNFY